MKKTIILALSLIMTIGAFAQNYQDWSRWSIAIEGGLNRFDGDVTQDKGYTLDVVPGAKTKLALGGLLEYNLTPVWSIGADYYYLPLAGTGSYYNFETNMHNAGFFTSFNLIKAFFQHSNMRWALHANIGLGYSWHTINYQTKTDDDWVSGVKTLISNGKPIVKGAGGVLFEDWDMTDTKGNAMVIPMSMLLEYNISNSLAVGLRGQFRGYNKDDIEGRYRFNTNDALEMATLGLRYKLNANIKDHLRNISVAKFRGDVQKTDLDRLQDQINGIVIPADPTERLDNLDRRVQKLEDILCPDDPDTDGDGVPDCRDKEPNTPAGNQVDFWGRTIKTAVADEIFDEKAFIYFEFDKTDLDTEALKAVQITADKLKADPTLIVEVRGFTDNMGTDEYNQGLSQRRADKVKNELVNAHGIEADRIIANGKGKFNPTDKIAKYRPYRTCVFFYNK